MRLALERGSGGSQATEVSSGRSRLVSALALGGLGTLVGASVLAGGGSTDAALPWIGGGAWGFVATLVGAAAVGRLPWPRPTTVALASLLLFGGLAAWTGFSVLWSYAPDRSWSYFNRDITYAGLLAAGLFVAALTRRAPTRFVEGLALLTGAVLAWSLAGKIAPGLFEDGARAARLRAPVGYWNSLAMVYVLGLPLALGLAGDSRRRPVVRALAAVLLFGLVVGLVLTYSRAGILLGILVAAAWLAFAPRRIEALGALLLAVPIGAAVAAWALRQPGLAEDGQDYATRVADGRGFGLALGVAGLAVFALGLGAARLEMRMPIPGERRRAVGATLSVAALLALGATAGGLAAKNGHPIAWLEAKVRELRSSEAVDRTPDRLGSVSLDSRGDWWEEAWRGFRSEPLTGTGANTFELVHRRYRAEEISVTQPHNFALQLLSDTGIVGFLLGSGAALAGLWAASVTVRRLPVEERTAGTAILIGVSAAVAHGLVDFDWDFVAITGTALVGLGALFSPGRASPARRPVAAVPVVAIFVLAVISLAAPKLGERRVDHALGALDRGEVETAIASLEAARSLDPLTLDPLFVRAEIASATGDEEAARRALEHAVEAQPQNPETWYQLGLFELTSGGGPGVALSYAKRAQALDPHDPSIAELVQAAS